MTLIRSRTLPVLLTVVAITCGALAWLRSTTDAVRTEVRQRFFEQYSRQQYLVAELAAHSLEETFAAFHNSLDLTASLFEGETVTRSRARDVSGTLKKIYGSLSRTPVIDLVVFDRKGIAVAIEPADPYTLGRSYAWRDYFRWAERQGKTGQMYLSPFMRLEGGKNRGDKALIVAEGIYGRHGEFHGVVMFTLNFDELARRHVLSVHIGKQGNAWLVDSSNRNVLVDPNGQVGGLSFEEAFLPRWPHLFRFITSLGKAPGSGLYEYQTPDNPGVPVRKVVSFHPVRIEDRVWTLGVATPEREIESLLTSFLHRQETFARSLVGTVVGVAVLLLTLLVTWNRVLTARVRQHTGDLILAHSRLESTFEELLATRNAAAVGQLALGLAHEIRNPLAAIQMNMQMIRKKIDAAGTLRENFTIVEGEIQRLNTLLNDVLEFARSRPLRLRSADVGEMVDRLIRLMNQRLEELQIRTEVRIAAPVVLVCDPEQIHQVLLNLLLNALEAMQGANRERIATFEAAARDGMAVIRVSDTGHGIPQEKLDRLFDPFFTTKASGGGLGLSILQTIVHHHGGSVAVASEPGEGTTVIVTLPLAGPAEPGETA